MARVFAIVIAAYLLIGIALSIRLHRFRGGVWILVIALTGFIWPLTLFALRLDNERRLLWPLPANDNKVDLSSGDSPLAPHGTTESQTTNEAKNRFWRRFNPAHNQSRRVEAAQRFLRALTELSKAERQEGGPTLEQRLAVV